ncbi:hypothetical protein BN940_10811 [Castellaniella defragrans 65Phen]|uniref:Uncharacterized protein n=1 Tax=Castellaniella defragrans (strain DSM 12143 / CCUG 39792 / 65Phen) TaxID=1437824 RepID=W8X454_CASD6|nr:hypothetical protein BN940_10811 [Castellaniella defragrans 65Phen]
MRFGDTLGGWRRAPGEERVVHFVHPGCGWGVRLRAARRRSGWRRATVSRR